MEDLAAHIIAEVLGIPVTEVVDELEFQSIPEWDSITHVKLMGALEERLGVEISAHQLVELASVHEIRAFVADHAGT